MIEPRDAKFQWGQRVVALDDLVNDGSFPDQPEDAVLARAGDVGEVVQVGHHVDANVPIYLVEFNGLVLGCLEEEIGVLERGLVPAA